MIARIVRQPSRQRVSMMAIRFAHHGLPIEANKRCKFEGLRVTVAATSGRGTAVCIGI
jgi:hypothetical protein